MHTQYKNNLQKDPLAFTLLRTTDFWASRPFTLANANLYNSDIWEGINLKLGLWQIDYFTAPFLLAQNVVVQPTHIFTLSVDQTRMHINRLWGSCWALVLNSTISGHSSRGLYGCWQARCNKSPCWGLIGKSKAPQLTVADMYLF